MACSLLSGLAVLGSIYILHIYHMPNHVQPSVCMVVFIYGLQKCLMWSHSRSPNQKTPEVEMKGSIKCTNCNSSDDVTNNTSQYADGNGVVNQNTLEITVDRGQMRARSESSSAHKHSLNCNKGQSQNCHVNSERGTTITHRCQHTNNGSGSSANASSGSRLSMRNASQYTHFRNCAGRNTFQSANSGDDIQSTKYISWQQIARVLDRFFFWLFLAANVIVTITLLAIYPAIKKL